MTNLKSKKKSTWGGARPNSGGKRERAGRPPKSVKLNDGQQIGFFEHGIQSERLATIKIVKRGTFQIQRANGDIITIMTN